jgi:hypothetical protein
MKDSKNTFSTLLKVPWCFLYINFLVHPVGHNVSANKRKHSRKITAQTECNQYYRKQRKLYVGETAWLHGLS